MQSIPKRWMSDTYLLTSRKCAEVSSTRLLIIEKVEISRLCEGKDVSHTIYISITLPS